MRELTAGELKAVAGGLSYEYWGSDGSGGGGGDWDGGGDWGCGGDYDFGSYDGGADGGYDAADTQASSNTGIDGESPLTESVGTGDFARMDGASYRGAPAASGVTFASAGSGLGGAPNNIAITTFSSILALGSGLGPVGGLVLNFGVAAAQDYYEPSTNPNGQISDWSFP